MMMVDHVYHENLTPESAIKVLDGVEVTMARAMNQVVFEPLAHAESWTLPVYEKLGGYEAWRRILREKVTPRGRHRGGEGLGPARAAAARASRPA